MNADKSCSWVIVFLACGIGCSSSSQFEVSQAPTKAFKSFGQVEVSLFTVNMAKFSSADSDVQNQIRDIPENLQSQIAKKMAKRKLLQDVGGEKIVISGRIDNYDPGDRTARWLFGFGAGEGKITAAVSFLDGQGNAIARGTAIGRVQSGFAGGSMDSAVDELADAIVSFIKANFDQTKK